MSKFIACYHVRSTAVVCLAIAAAVHLSSADAQSPDNASNLQLVRSLESAVQAIETLPAFDVGGITVHTKDFGTGRTPVSETNRFRMQVAPDREVLRYVAEIRSASAAGNVKAGESVTTSIWINGNTVHRSNAVNGTEQYSSVVQFQSFQEAIKKGGAPAPGYWGLRNFPSYPDAIEGLHSWTKRISDGNATVTATKSDDTIRYAAQFDEESGARSRVVHWEFKLPTHLPTLYMVERVTKGKHSTIAEQNVDYTIIDGHEVPSVIRSWVPAVKREPKELRLGKHHRVTKLKWLEISDDAVEVSPKLLTTPEEIDSFLSDAPASVPLDANTQ